MASGQLLTLHVFMVFVNNSGSVTSRSQVVVILITDLGQDGAMIYQENNSDTGEKDHADYRCSSLR